MFSSFQPAAEAGFIPEELEEQFLEAFSLFDHDGDGSITMEEFVETLIALGQNPSEEELEEMMKEFDADGNGELDFEEFKCLMVKKMKSTDGGEAIREAFHALDARGRGHVTTAEIYALLTTLGEKLTPAEMDQMLSEIGTVKETGRMDYDDFKDLVNSLTSK